MVRHEVFIQAANGDPQLVVLPIQGDAVQAPRQTQPLPWEPADPPLKALDCRDQDFVDQERPENPWEDAMLVYPGLKLGRSDLSTTTSQAFISWLVARIAVCLRLQSNTFPRLFTGFSVMDRICQILLLL